MRQFEAIFPDRPRLPVAGNVPVPADHHDTDRMCGFAGIFTGQPLRADTLRERVGAMAATVSHRGPDDSGIWLDASHGVAFGFRRLAIIDLSEQGHQPMRSASGRFTVVFNGEVYNYAELQRELEAAGSPGFRGHSDTEVVLAAFERWGIRRALDRFIGMFAMGIWDARERTVTLVRDRLGIKPLYVHSAGGTVLFGSELKALIADPAFDRSIDPVALASYFRQLCVPSPLTIFAKTRKLPPGSLLTIRDPSGPLPEPETFWSAIEAARHGARDPFTGTDEEAVEELERLLRRAVALRMRSDVPIGALLSGGIDSSVVTALMRESSALPIRTFCIGFDDARHDETTHAAAVARHLGTDHTEVRLSGADALATVPRITEIFDEPFADPSQIPSLLVCELARRHVTVALAGDGGDELFAGYNRYTYGNRAIAWAGRSPAVLRRAAAWPLRALSADRLELVGGTVQRMLPRRLQERLIGEKLGKLGALLGEEGPPHMYRSLVSAWSDAESPVPQERRGPDAVDYAFSRSGLAGTLPRMLLADQIGYLPDDLLAKVDRVSMAVSLEVRVPLIDHNVVEFSWRLPKDAKIRRGRGKWILREVLHRHVPRALVERPKTGFSVPLAEWLRGPLRPWAEELLGADRLRHAGLLDVGRVRRSWASFLAGDSHLALRLWTILMFEAWRDRWAHTPTA